VLRFAYTLTQQIGQTALTNARGTLEDRLSRWLLMTHDRIDANDMYLTHDLLATMLGVRRAGVSVAIKSLEQRGLITVRRGTITIVNREGLEANAHGAYGAAERGLARFES
jgi:CRP-like cAMP-binding protein